MPSVNQITPTVKVKTVGDRISYQFGEIMKCEKLDEPSYRSPVLRASTTKTLEHKEVLVVHLLNVRLTSVNFTINIA